MAKSNGGPGICIGQNCEWAIIRKTVVCVAGTGGCSPSNFLTADESSFHDKNLVDATKKLNRILARIPEDSKGRKLSFCETKNGTLLAWVKHSGKSPAGRTVTRNDSDAAVAKALKLKSYHSAR